LRTLKELNNVIGEIKAANLEFSEKQQIKLNKLERKLDRLEGQVIVSKLNNTSLVHKNEILDSLADLDISIVKPVVYTIDKISDTDLPEILAVIQAIPKTDIGPLIAAIEVVPTNDDITSVINQLTAAIMGYDSIDEADDSPSIPNLFENVNSLLEAGNALTASGAELMVNGFLDMTNRLDEITGKINGISEDSSASQLETCIDDYEAYIFESMIQSGYISPQEHSQMPAYEQPVSDLLDSLEGSYTNDYALK